jgi:tetratricopeptide (TPR) repeat protein
MGDIVGALEDANEVLRREPDPVAFMRRAAIREATGDVDGVIADATEAIRLRPGLVEAYAVRGTARITRGDRAGAVQDFARALELAPPGWPRRPLVEQYLKDAAGSK